MRWVFYNNPAMYSAHPAVDLPKPTNLMRGGQAQYCAFLPVSVIFDIPRKIFKWLRENSQIPGKLYCVNVFYAVIWVSQDPLITLVICAVIWVLKVPFSCCCFVAEPMLLAPASHNLRLL